MLRAMNPYPRRSTWLPALAFAFLAAPAFGETVMNGEVTLDYYVGDTDTEGYEYASSDFYVRQIDNTGGQTGPLSLSGWATTGANPAGPGDEIGHAPIGPAPANSTLDDFSATADAQDLPPGEYYAHVLLQDDSIPGSYEDSRTMTPRLLWRGGLEAAGPLRLYPYNDGRSVEVDFDALRNNRIDSRYTGDIVLTLYATYGFGPASDGYTLCSVRVSGLYAGDSRSDPGFTCAINDVPDGDYTVHLEVAEAGGRGGSSTLSGPDETFRGGSFDQGRVTVYASALSPWLLLALGLPGLLRAPMLRRALLRA
jgi:hypothetical protein